MATSLLVENASTSSDLSASKPLDAASKVPIGAPASSPRANALAARWAPQIIASPPNAPSPLSPRLHSRHWGRGRGGLLAPGSAAGLEKRWGGLASRASRCGQKRNARRGSESCRGRNDDEDSPSADGNRRPPSPIATPRPVKPRRPPSSQTSTPFQNASSLSARQKQETSSSLRKSPGSFHQG